MKALDNLMWGEWAIAAVSTMLLITQTKLHPIACAAIGWGAAWLADTIFAPVATVRLEEVTAAYANAGSGIASGSAPSANIPEPSEWEQ